MLDGTTVTLTFEGRLPDGTVYDKMTAENPLVFQVGHDMVLDGFEREVREMVEGEKKTFTIKDTKKPTVSGVKNGKTYIGAKVVKFKDNCGIAKATLNGKKISSGKKISKKGSYKLVVTDINGLKTIVSFKIK